MGGDPPSHTPAPDSAATVAPFRAWRGSQFVVAKGPVGPPSMPFVGKTKLTAFGRENEPRDAGEVDLVRLGRSRLPLRPAAGEGKGLANQEAAFVAGEEQGEHGVFAGGT